MERVQKEAVVADLHDAFKGAALVVVTHFTGLDVGEATALRRRMREAGASFRVTKNRLAKRALEGTAYGDLAALFDGPTAIAYSGDPVAAAKVAVDFAKANNKLVIVGGAIGEQGFDRHGIEALARLPSLDALRATLVVLVQAPATKIAAVLQAPGGQLARVMAAYGEHSGAASG